MARKSPPGVSMRNLTPAITRGLLIGLLLVLMSLPGLFALHGALGLGSPPITGLLLLGGAVALALVGANIAGVLMGESRQKPVLAALVGFGIGVVVCTAAAPFYGGMVMDGLTHDAMGMAWNEREHIVQGARNAASSGAFNSASDTLSAVREGRLREELGKLQEQAHSATTPQARQNATAQAKVIAAQLAPRGIELLKLSAARVSAFALLLWAIIAPPFGAAFECRRAARR
ncbi:hypothetical protein IAD21_03057 [Abditibacteriota bacterium]|nr:hypothetical protein IAD21_03057 [Abditibacteriota bacterium]